MDVKERILSIKLMEKLNEKPEFAKEIGLVAEVKCKENSQSFKKK